MTAGWILTSLADYVRIQLINQSSKKGEEKNAQTGNMQLAS